MKFSQAILLAAAGASTIVSAAPFKTHELAPVAGKALDVTDKLLNIRDLEDDFYARGFDDDLDLRDLEDEIYARDFDDGLDLRDLEDEIYARDFDDGLDLRDLEDEIYARNFDDDLAIRDFADELEARVGGASTLVGVAKAGAKFLGKLHKHKDHKDHSDPIDTSDNTNNPNERREFVDDFWLDARDLELDELE
ncbi:hypothetical protein H0H92_009873 [Tricholoma furcatifolium]|nr:hypothetical protein H0H92_009873 [Tricholoma furcatifolium]